MSDNPIFSYTRRDYEGARKEGIAKIPLLSKGNWTDLNATDPGIIILDYVHALVDMINYYQDHQALESFLPTAKERTNIFRLAKQLNYPIRSSKGASVVVNFHSDLVYDHIIKIPKNTTVSTFSDIKYITTEDAYLLAGQTDISIKCIQGERYERVYRGTGISSLSNVESPANQYVNLLSTTIDVDSIHIVDSIGREWSRISHIVFSDDVDRVYQAELNPDDTITIKFGDGERGIVPQTDDILTISYIVNNAEEGRVEAGAIAVLDDLVHDETDGKYIEFSVTNPEKSIGGYSAQSSTSIRELAPGVIKSQERAVTLSDFENLAKQVEGVATAKAYDINSDPDVCPNPTEVKVLVVPEAGQDASEDLLLDKVFKYLYDRMLPPTYLQVTAPTSEYIDLTIEVLKLSTYSEDSIKYQIERVVREYFLEISTYVGESYYPAELMNRVSKIEGIRRITNFLPLTPVDINKLSVAKLGTLTIDVQ